MDYVYLVSCKYGSKLLHNASPSHLFDRLLAIRRFYTACRDHLGGTDLPEKVTDLNRDQRNRLKKAFKRHWPTPLKSPYQQFAAQVSNASAQRWATTLGNRAQTKEELLWRLLRLQPAPYFVLGTFGKTPRAVPD